MGGPLWTAMEEAYFWTDLVPMSDKRIGYNKKSSTDPIKTWEELAKMMRTKMAAQFGAIGELAPRNYTSLTLSEHWDKNVMQGRVSKAAAEYVEKYVEEMERAGGLMWEKRQRRMNKRLGIEEEDGEAAGPKAKKRKVSAASVTSPAAASSIPAVAAASTTTAAAASALQEGAPTRGPGSSLPSIADLLRGPEPAFTTGAPTSTSGPAAPAAASLAASQRSHAQYQPDNGYTLPPPPAPGAGDFVRRDEVERLVRDAVERRMSDIDDLVRGDIRALVGDAVDRRMDAVRTLVRDEIARAVSSRHRAAAAVPTADHRPELGRRHHHQPAAAAATAAPAPAPAPAPAYYQQQAPSSSSSLLPRRPVVGQLRLPLPEPRTSLPTGRGRALPSSARSRVHGEGSRYGSHTAGAGAYGDEDEDEDEDEDW